MTLFGTPSTWDGLTPPYKTVVADPPWFIEGTNPKGFTNKTRYSTLTLREICALPVQELVGDNAHLWLWGVNRIFDHAFVVARSWGFKPVTMLTWCKAGPGVGHYLRTNTEHMLFATKGEAMVPEEAYLASWVHAPRSAHSVKPGVALDIVEQVSPGPYVELFARQGRFGWDTWGKGYEA